MFSGAVTGDYQLSTSTSIPSIIYGRIRICPDVAELISSVAVARSWRARARAAVESGSWTRENQRSNSRGRRSALRIRSVVRPTVELARWMLCKCSPKAKGVRQHKSHTQTHTQICLPVCVRVSVTINDSDTSRINREHSRKSLNGVWRCCSPSHTHTHAHRQAHSRRLAHWKSTAQKNKRAARCRYTWAEQAARKLDRESDSKSFAWPAKTATEAFSQLRRDCNVHTSLSVCVCVRKLCCTAAVSASRWQLIEHSILCASSERFVSRS